MKKINILLLIGLLGILNCGVRKAVQPGRPATKLSQQLPSELRGVWITRFNYAHTNPDTMRNRIINILEQTAKANFNAVFFQVRGQAETFYPSPLEPWSKLIDFRDPGFDPVRLVVEEAHRRKLKFYAYINLLPIWNGDDPPKAPNHLYYTHGPHVNPDSSWVCFGSNGKPMKKNEYYYLNPALPQVKTYLKGVIKHFVEKYDVDGLHFDRIRYPGFEYIHDPYSLKTFAADSLQMKITKSDWARRQLSDLVEDVVVEALLVKPYLIISAATWGMYRTDDIEDYGQFGSGYHTYYQDAIDWLDRGIMDFIVPMIYWDIPDPLPNFDDLWKDFRKRTPNYRHVYPGVRVRPKLLESDEIAKQINFVRKTGGKGTVMFDFRSLKGEGLEIVRQNLYHTKVDLPQNLKRITPEQVVGLGLEKLIPESRGGQRVTVTPDKRRKRTDQNGRLGLIFSEKPDSLLIRTENRSIPLKTKWWRTPFNYSVEADSTVSREFPWVEFRRIPNDTTTNEEFHFLCKTDYPAQAWINGDSAKVYKTGIFFDKLVLNEGKNRVCAKIKSGESDSAKYVREFYYKKIDKTRKPFPLWFDEKSIEPAENLILQPEDVVQIGFRGSKGQEAIAEVKPLKVKLPFSRKDFADYSYYQTELPLQLLKKDKTYKIELILKSTSPESKKEKLKYSLKSSIQVKEAHQFPLVKTTQHNSLLYYSLGKIRLGPPLIAEYEPGVILKTSGKIGENYRIYLNRNEEGYIHQEYVGELPAETIKPSYYVRSISCTPAEDGDIIRIPYSEPVPYSIYPEPDQNRIIISLYGAKTASTWIIHRKGLKVIEKVVWKQATPETYQVIVNLKTSKIWGYDITTAGSSLILHIKYPPVLDMNDSFQPLSDLNIAIEAGHGGDNLGAVGLSGVFEKDINLDLAQKLADICRENGMNVLQVRDSDKYMTLTEKRDTVLKSCAHLLVSIHANSGGSSNSYLGVSGTSTYYNNPFWAKFAEMVYNHLLELELEEFGVVGSFNYKVIRVHSRPTILVEQAFLSNAEDEEKLASEEFRQNMAEKIYAGIIEFVEYMLE
jgi:N-acetylmuramoyl-L-alanine amidase